ncbi:MAG: hypothetical protein HQL49_13250 [Gammaproteobacteria bacterium]|nr:hypothetical protein [Gammaproteobacteria bacterium]
MDYFNYHDGELFAENIPLTELAERFGTPLYVYSRATLERHYHAFNIAFAAIDHLLCYAVKANSNIALLNLMARLGAGFDIVSLGELERVLAAGGSADKVIFSGVGKRVDEFERALAVGIHCFNVESEEVVVDVELVGDSDAVSLSSPESPPQATSSRANATAAKRFEVKRVSQLFTRERDKAIAHLHR